jgi:hypothetical protein
VRLGSCGARGRAEVLDGGVWGGHGLTAKSRALDASKGGIQRIRRAGHAHMYHQSSEPFRILIAGGSRAGARKVYARALCAGGAVVRRTPSPPLPPAYVPCVEAPRQR